MADKYDTPKGCYGAVAAFKCYSRESSDLYMTIFGAYARKRLEYAKVV